MYKFLMSILPTFGLLVTSFSNYSTLPANETFAKYQLQSTSIQNALAVLKQFPIETELRTLDYIALTLSSSLDALDEANSLVQVTQSIKVIPGAWSGLIFILNGFSPGLGTSLEDLDSNIQMLIAMKQDLEDLNDLDHLADQITLFTSSPTESNLLSLKTEINIQINDLISLQSNLSKKLLDVDRLIQNIEMIRSAISQKAKELILIEGITQNINSLNSTLERIQTVIRSTSTKLRDFLTPLNHITGVLNAIRNNSTKVTIQALPEIGFTSTINNSASNAYYYPLADCNGSYLHIGDRVTVSTGSGSQGIRSTPDTHPSNNIIARVPEGGGMTIVGGPQCNYGWVLWQVKTDNGEYGWTPESNGSTQWLILPNLNVSDPKPRAWYHPFPDCAGSYLAIGDHVTVIPGTGSQTIRSSANIAYDANNKIGQIPEGAGMTIISGPKCS